MNRKLLILSLVLSAFVISCNSDDNTGTIEGNSPQNDPFKVTTNTSDLQKAVNLDNAGVLSITSITAAKNFKGKAEDIPQISNIGLEQIANIEPPKVNGNAMRASHVDVDGNYAYVAYTKEGATYLGGIDIIDISDKHNPKVLSRAVTDMADINALFYKNGYLYFTGAYWDGDPATGPNRAMKGFVEIRNGEFTSNFSIETGIQGQTGVAIVPSENNNFLLLTGSDGVIEEYSAGNAKANAVADFSDLRSAAYKDGKTVALSGTTGLMELQKNNNSFKANKEIAISGITPEAKRTISFYNNLVMVSEGENGVGIYNLEAQNLIARLPINTLDNNEVASENKVTNAVTTTDGFIFQANGGAGLGISKLTDNNLLSEEGIIEGNSSANYVVAKGDYIFVASGTGGLRIIKMSKPAPINQANDVFEACSSYPPYNGNPWLNVNSGEEKAYNGSATVNGINVNQKLTFCGSLNVRQSVNINSNGEFNMRGAMAIGQYRGNYDLNINSNAVLRIEGSLTVYGNLNLNSGATLEFVGQNSSIHVFGEVHKNSNITIKGDYTDTSNKL